MNAKNPLLRLPAGLLALAAATVHADPVAVVFYDFDVEDPTNDVETEGPWDFINAPTTLAAGIASATAWSTAEGTVLNQNGQLKIFDGEQYSSRAIGAGSPDSPWTATQTLGFDFTIADGMRLTITSISFDERFGGTGGGGGPQRAMDSFNLLVNGVEVGGGAPDLAPGDPFDSWSFALALANLTGTVEIRLTADNPVAAASWRIDNFLIEGELTPVPLPAAAWLFGSALGGLALWRRRSA